MEGRGTCYNVLGCATPFTILALGNSAIFAECVDVATSIGKVKFKHCSRMANGAAHEVAKYSFCNENSVSWINDPPGWLISTLVDDVKVYV